jgi:hypothetical protein
MDIKVLKKSLNRFVQEAFVRTYHAESGRNKKNKSNPFCDSVVVPTITDIWMIPTPINGVTRWIISSSPDPRYIIEP